MQTLIKDCYDYLNACQETIEDRSAFIVSNDISIELTDSIVKFMNDTVYSAKTFTLCTVQELRNLLHYRSESTRSIVICDYSDIETIANMTLCDNDIDLFACHMNMRKLALFKVKIRRANDVNLDFE